MTHLEPASPLDRPADVAARVLAARLAAVRATLPLAARHAAEDPEHVHHLRVAARRAVAALELFAPLVPCRGARRLRRALVRMRRAAGAARDCDVLMARLHDAALGRALERRRRRAQRPLEELARRWIDGGRLDRRVAKFLRRLAERGGASPYDDFRAWAAAALLPCVTAFVRAFRTADAGPAALHRLRIAGKRLRYAGEVLAGAFPARFAGVLLPRLEAIQDELGDLNDRGLARRRIGRRVARAHDPLERARLAELLADEHAQYAAALRSFLARWTPADVSQLEQDLRAAVQAERPEDRRLSLQCSDGSQTSRRIARAPTHAAEARW